MEGGDTDSLQAKCLADAKAKLVPPELCGCLGCVSCKYSNPNAGPGGTSVNWSGGLKAGDPPNMHIPYQRYGPYGIDDPDAFASEIWTTTEDDLKDNPYKAFIGTDRDLFLSNLYGMRAMFSNEVAHNWTNSTGSLRIDGRENNKYSCVARRMGNDTCGTFDGFSNWSWKQFSAFLDSFASQPKKLTKDAPDNLQELAIYEWQFVPPEWLKDTPAADTLKHYP